VRSERAISSGSSSPCSEAASRFEAGWPKPARCSTARSQPRGWWTIPKASPGTSSTVPTQPSPAETSTWPSRPRKRRSTLRNSSTPAPSRHTRRSRSPTPASRPATQSGQPSSSSSSPGGNELRLIGGGWRARYLELLTRSFLAAGRRDDAQHAAAAAQNCAEAVGLPMAGAIAALAAAAIDLHDGAPGAAANKALDAAAALEKVEDLFDAATARCRRTSARPNRRARPRGGRARNRSRGVRVLRLAPLPLAGRTGTPEARPVNLPPHPPRQGNGSGIDSLTARELQIARLVVDRKTNPQIAAELFLSSKTVETHLRNTFRKLGVSSRVEVARVVERADRSQ
jgi:DNA-binding CsgD family transcriptional regulator